MTLATLFTAAAALTLKGLGRVDRSRESSSSFLRASEPIVKTFECVIEEREWERITHWYLHNRRMLLRSISLAGIAVMVVVAVVIIAAA